MANTLFSSLGGHAPRVEPSEADRRMKAKSDADKAAKDAAEAAKTKPATTPSESA